jgi:glycosyltransferase involved in cell wall biosynthesis
MKKLFILSLGAGYGGAERSIELIARHLPPGIRLHLYVQNREHLARLRQPGALPEGMRLVQLAASQTLFGKRRAALRLILDYLRLRPDALLINTCHAALIAAMMAKRLPGLGARCHLYVRDFLWRDLDYIFGRLTGARVLVPSTAVTSRAGYLSAHVQPIGAATCSVLPDMVAVDGTPPRHDGPILHLATVNPWKGHADLMLAAAHLQAQGRPVEILSHGIHDNTELHHSLQQLRERLHLAEHFELGGYLADPIPLLSRCRAVVVASVSHSGGPETFGRTVIEAWAQRKPVIAYAAGAPARLIEHEVDGLLVPEGDTLALAEALQRLWSDPVLGRRLGEAGHAKTLAHYEAGQVTRRLLLHLGLTTGEPR